MIGTWVPSVFCGGPAWDKMSKGAVLAKRTKVPRASIACTILDDPEYVDLMLTQTGREALALWTALLCLAKAQDNGGVFNQKDAVVAALVRWPAEAFRRALVTLCENTNWIERDDGTSAWTIRNYAKWNSWGGNRGGAGRKSSCNQDGIKFQSKVHVPVTDTDTGTNYTHTPDEIVIRDDDHRATFDKFWAIFPRKTAQGRAWQYWDRMNAEERKQALLYAEAYAEVFQAAADDRRTFFKGAAKWLEDRCWEDDPNDWALSANVGRRGSA